MQFTRDQVLKFFTEIFWQKNVIQIFVKVSIDNYKNIFFKLNKTFLIKTTIEKSQIQANPD